MLEVAQGGLVIAPRLEYLTNIIEAVSFTRFVLDFLTDGQRLLQIAQGHFVIAQVKMLFAGLVQSLRPHRRVGRGADLRQQVILQQGVVEAGQGKRANDVIQGKAVGFGLSVGGPHGPVGDNGLGDGGPLAAVEVMLVGGGGLPQLRGGGGVVLAGQPGGRQGRKLVLLHLPGYFVLPFHQAHGQQAL